MRRSFVAALALAAPCAARAQAPATPAGLPPIRPLGPAVAVAARPFGSLAAVRALPGGRVLVNDVANRRVLLLDSTLATYTVVADATTATGNAYSSDVAGLIPYRGDSTLLVNPQSLSMLVIGPAGKLGRTMAVPRPNDAVALTGLTFGTPGFDAKGRLVYRPMPDFRRSPGARPAAAPAPPDSAPIVRVDLTTRRVDTLALVKVWVPRGATSPRANGGMWFTEIINPLPVVDDWAVLSDGTVMILRGRDFHADLIGADGAPRSAPRMPHEWQRMSDEAKIAFVDSTRAAIEKQRAEARAAERRTNGGGTAPARSEIGGPGGEPPRRRGGAGGGATNGSGASGADAPAVETIPPSELPDYKPPFAAGGARADADGGVWVRLIPTRPMPGPVYAVIDARGKLIDRVVLPPNSAVAGFGPGGVVYLGVRDSAGVRLERRRAR